METLLLHPAILLTAFVFVLVCAFLAVRTRFALLFTILEGIASLFVISFLLWQAASMEELLFALLVLLSPSLFLRWGKGGDEK